jgi:phosphoglycerate dehydrogenase-like enzyme
MRSTSLGTQVVQQSHPWRRVIMQARRKIAVAGATGRVGRHVVDVLEAQGHDVVGMSRSLGVDVVSKR